MQTKHTTLAILLFLLFGCIVLSLVWWVYFTGSQQDRALCADELKRCPDGSFVTLGGPLCSYPKCPETPKQPMDEAAGQISDLAPDASGSAPVGEAIANFYTWYQGLKPAQKQNLSFDKRQDLTADFKARLEGAQGRSDLLMCVTGKIDSFIVGAVFTSGSRAMAFVSLGGDLGSQNALVELVNKNDSWQINDIFCQADASKAAGQPQLEEQPADTAPSQLNVE